MLTAFKNNLKMLATRHSPNGEPNVLLHSLPRSGSTWLMELVLTQPGFTSCNEPLNLRKDMVRANLGLSDWRELHSVTKKEQVLRYLSALESGRLRDSRYPRPAPFSQFYRPKTYRTVFKIIHGGEEYINDISARLNGKVLFLIRHPIPVSISRQYFPKLDTILDTDVRQYFDVAQLKVAEQIVKNKARFSCGILDWCLRNYIALRSRTSEWTVLTYEQLVLDPAPAVQHLARRLLLPEPSRLLERLSVPSQSTSLSDRDTREALYSDRGQQQQRWLIEKWRERVSDDQLSTADEILTLFGLHHIYTASEAAPNPEYWISSASSNMNARAD